MFYIQCYLLLINALGLLLMLSDKRKAVRAQRRIPESRLLTAAVLGGSLGVYLGMKLFRHKTRKDIFKFGVPLTLCAHILIFLVLIIKT